MRSAENYMAGNESVEEHWRMILLERLQKLESSIEVIRAEVVEVKTSAAVAAHEAKSRSDAMNRVESDIKDLAKLVRDLEKSLADAPKGQGEIDKRVKVLEEWQANLVGRLSILGILGAALTSLATAVLVKTLTE